MSDMSKIPGTPAFIAAHKSATKTDTQLADSEKAKAEVKEDTKYTGGGEGSKG